MAKKYMNRFAIEEEDQFEIHVKDYNNEYNIRVNSRVNSEKWAYSRNILDKSLGIHPIIKWS